MTDPRRGERCPPRADLLCAVEDELSAEERLPLLDHLARCRACRDGLAQVARFTQLAALLDPAFDAPPSRALAFDAAGAAARAHEFQERLHAQKQALIHVTGTRRSLRHWLSVAAAISVLVVGFVLTWTQAPLHADELVFRAAATERARAAGWSHNVRFRATPTTPALLGGTSAPAAAPRLRSLIAVREVTDQGMFDVGPVLIASDGPAAAAFQLLAANGFNPRLPFSMEKFQAWRTSHANRREHVAERGALYVLHVTIPDGALREAQLLVRRDTFRVVGLSLVFEGTGRIDVEEVDEPLPRPDAASALASSPSASMIASYLASIPRASTPTSAPALVASAAPRAVARPELSAWRARTFGNEEARAAFVPELTRLVSAVNGHLCTLGDLAAADRSPRIARASAAARAAHRQAIDRAYRALTADLEALNGPLGTMFGISNRAAAAQQAPADWARRTAAAAPYADALARHLDDLLALDDVPATDGGHPLNVTFGTIWDLINAAQRP